MKCVCMCVCAAKEGLLLGLVQCCHRTATAVGKSKRNGRLEDAVAGIFSMEIGSHGEMG